MSLFELQTRHPMCLDYHRQRTTRLHNRTLEVGTIPMIPTQYTINLHMGNFLPRCNRKNILAWYHGPMNLCLPHHCTYNPTPSPTHSLFLLPIRTWTDTYLCCHTIAPMLYCTDKKVCCKLHLQTIDWTTMKKHPMTCKCTHQWFDRNDQPHHTLTLDEPCPYR